MDIHKGQFLTSGGVWERPIERRRQPPPTDNIDELRARLTRVKECLDYVKGEDPNESRGDRIDWLLKNGGL